MIMGSYLGFYFQYEKYSRICIFSPSKEYLGAVDTKDEMRRFINKLQGVSNVFQI